MWPSWTTILSALRRVMCQSPRTLWGCPELWSTLACSWQECITVSAARWWTWAVSIHFCTSLSTAAGRRLTPMMSPLILVCLLSVWSIVWSETIGTCAAKPTSVFCCATNSPHNFASQYANRNLWESLCVKIGEKVGTDCFQVCVCRTFTFFVQQRLLFLVIRFAMMRPEVNLAKRLSKIFCLKLHGELGTRNYVQWCWWEGGWVDVDRYLRRSTQGCDRCTSDCHPVHCSPTLP